MKYLLDTNIVVHFLRGAFNLDEQVRKAGLENCFISEITLLELMASKTVTPLDRRNKDNPSTIFRKP